jgi:hypothetical protein
MWLLKNTVTYYYAHLLHNIKLTFCSKKRLPLTTSPFKTHTAFCGILKRSFTPCFDRVLRWINKTATLPPHRHAPNSPIMTSNFVFLASKLPALTVVMVAIVDLQFSRFKWYIECTCSSTVTVRLTIHIILGMDSLWYHMADYEH